MKLTCWLIIQLLIVIQNPKAQAQEQETQEPNDVEVRTGTINSFQSMDYDLERLIWEVIKPAGDNHNPHFFSYFSSFDVNKMVTKLSLDPEKTFMLNELNQLDPHQTFIGGTDEQEVNTRTYLVALQNLQFWPTEPMQHFSKEDFEMPKMRNLDMDVLRGRDACDLVSCLTGGSIYALLKEFVVNLDVYPESYMGVTNSDNFFWNEEFFRAMFNKYEPQSKQIISHEDANYLVLLTQFQVLKELRLNRIQSSKMRTKIRTVAKEHHRDLENKLKDFQEIFTNLKEELDTLRTRPDPSTVVATPTCSISEKIKQDVASLARILEMIQTDGLSNSKAEIQYKLYDIQQQATEMATTITDLRTQLIEITARITSFNSQDIADEISDIKEQMAPELESISQFAEEMNSEFSTTLKFIQGIHTKTKKFRECLQKTYVRYGIFSVLAILGGLTSLKLISIIWTTCICLVKEVNMLYKYHNMVLQEQLPVEEGEQGSSPVIHESPEVQLPLMDARFRGLLSG